MAQAGDIIINSLIIKSARGNLDLTSTLVSGRVFQSVFTPGIIAELDVMDTQNALGTMQFMGDEMVNFSFQTPGGNPSNYVFGLHKNDDVQMTAAGMGATTYKLVAVSQEALNAKTNYVQKSYSGLISDTVQDIHKNFLKSTKPIQVEPTKISQQIIVPNYSPYNAVDMVRRRAVSADPDSTSSSYVYFETMDPSADHQMFYFTTLEKLFGGQSVKKFRQDNTLGSDILQRTDDNILAMEIPRTFSAVDNIAALATNDCKFNFRTHGYYTNNVNQTGADFQTGGSIPYTSDDMIQKYVTSVKHPPVRLIPYDSSGRANTNITESTPAQRAFVATLMQNSMKISVMGDTILKAGDMIDAAIPSKDGFTGSAQLDPILSGKFLIASICHNIAPLNVQPRYTCSIELLKGYMGTGT